MMYLLLLVGFALLIKGADLLVDGASSVAKRFHVSDLVIGLTIVALGTSAPELFVNISAALKGTTDIAIGNVVGSNIVNTLLILGVASVIYPLRVGKGTVWKEIPMSLLAAVLLFVMANDRMVDGLAFGALTRSDGIVLISFFLIFLYYTFGIAKTQDAESVQDAPKVYSVPLSIAYMLAGLIGLTLGGRWIVTSATELALRFGLSDALVGLTVVAIGTSLPELATSAIAAYKKNADIAVGNIVGSNIFNIFWILGIGAVIRPLPFAPELNGDLLFVIGSSVLLFLWMFLGKRHTLERWNGVACILLYIGYIVSVVVRG